MPTVPQAAVPVQRTVALLHVLHEPLPRQMEELAVDSLPLYRCATNGHVYPGKMVYVDDCHGLMRMTPAALAR
jgi:hypothetical protein